MDIRRYFVWGFVALVGFGAFLSLYLREPITTNASSTSGSPSFLQLNAVIRDFKRGDQPAGHPDFNVAFLNGVNRAGHVPGLIEINLSQDGKPVYRPGHSMNSGGHDPFTSQTNFEQWYRDVPEVNQTLHVPINLQKQGAVYTTEGANEDIHFDINNYHSFLPINNQGWGNQGHPYNYSFTLELRNKFSYVPGQEFTFVGDDDAWAFINAKLVVDLGGMHNAVTGSVILFDGKAFVTKAHFNYDGIDSQVQDVTSVMASNLATNWTRLGLPGPCPINPDQHRYIDLDLNRGRGDIIVQHLNTREVRIDSIQPIERLDFKYTDGTNLAVNVDPNTYTGIFDGGADKTISALYVKTTPKHESADPGHRLFTPDGANNTQANLYFFQAERQFSGSNFRIDTNITLADKPQSVIQPMYD